MACSSLVVNRGQGVCRLGFAELNLGVPVPASSMQMLRVRVGIGAVNEAVLGGDGCDAERARELGLVHRAVPVQQVAVTADRELRKRGSRPARAYAATKEFLFADVWQNMRDVGPAGDRVFLDCWFDEQTRQRLAEVARSLGE